MQEYMGIREGDKGNTCMEESIEVDERKGMGSGIKFLPLNPKNGSN